MLYIFLILVFLRPFISSLAFIYANLIYYMCFFSFFCIWIILKGINQKKILQLKTPLLLFLASLCLSIAFSPDRLKSLVAFYQYTMWFFLIFIITGFSEKEKMAVIRLLLFSGLIISLLAVYQYFFGIKHTLDYIAKNNVPGLFALDLLQSKRVFFPFVTPNTLAGYLGLVLPLSFIYKDKYFFIVPLAVAIILTKSIAALSALFTGIIIYLYLQKKLDKAKVTTLIIFAIAAAAAWILRSANPKQHLQPLFSLSMRLHYWKDTLGIILKYPLSGIGIGNFNLAQTRFAHNSYLQLCAETGLLGLFAYFWLIIKIVKAGLKNKSDITNALLSAAMVFLVHNFFDFSFYLPEVSMPFWIVLSLLL